MNKRLNVIDVLSILCILVMTYFVCMSIAIVQSENKELTGENLAAFLIGFLVSIICTTIRFWTAYMRTQEQTKQMKKNLGIVYIIICVIIALFKLVMVLYNANCSIKSEYLWEYNKYQIFMVEMIVFQAIGVKLFAE